MRALRGLLRLLLSLRKTGSGVNITVVDTATSRQYLVSVLNDGTVRVTYTGTVRTPAKY